MVRHITSHPSLPDDCQLFLDVLRGSPFALSARCGLYIQTSYPYIYARTRTFGLSLTKCINM